MIAKGKYTKGTHMRVIDIILNEESEKSAFVQSKTAVLGPLPAEYNSRNKLHQGWAEVIGNAFSKCYNQQLIADAAGKQLRPSRKFTVTYEYLWNIIKNQNWKCNVLHIPLDQLGNADNNNRISIDRIDSAKGYVPSNIQFITNRVNAMKWTHDQTDFFNYCKLIVEYTNKHGVPVDPSDQTSSNSILEGRRNSVDVWKQLRDPLHYFLTSNTNEPLYTDLVTKTPWRSYKDNNTYEKKYLTPAINATFNRYYDEAEAAYNSGDIPTLSKMRSKIEMNLSKNADSAAYQMNTLKRYPEEIGTKSNVLISLEHYRDIMQKLNNGEEVSIAADSRYMGQDDRIKFANFIAQIDQMLATPPPLSQAVQLYTEIVKNIQRVATNSVKNIKKGISPIDFIANRVASSKFNVVDDEQLTPDAIATLDPRLQARILAQKQRGVMPDDWDNSNPEHKSWKDALNTALSRVLTRSTKREKSGKDLLDRHAYDTTHKELWNVINEQNWTCPYTGIKLEATGKGTDNQLSPDRINSNLGYISGNIRFVTYRVNVMKNNRSSQDFVNSCKKIVESQRSKKP